jgi:phosphinothricin acetyltransferase
MIRAAGAEDAEAIAAIWNPVIRDTAVTFNSVEKSVSSLVTLLEEKAALGHPFLLAEEAGHILGFATYGAFRGGVGYRRIAEHTILLVPEAQGRGVGRQLMAALEAVALAQGVASLMAGVSGENPAGIGFHRAMGFAEVGRIPQAGWKFGRWMDLVLMQKRLAAD